MRSWLRRIFRGVARAISFQDVWGTGRDSSSAVSQDRALQLGAVYGAIRIIADGVASMPLKEYVENTNGDRAQVALSPLWRQPAAEGTRYDWIHRLLTSLLLRGNAYGLIVATDFAGRPTQIEWLHPDDVQVVDNFNVRAPEWLVMGRPVDPLQFVHIPGFTLPGQVLGLSPIRAFALTMDTGLYAQQFGRDWFANGSTPSAVLESDAKVDQGSARIIKTRFQAASQGREPVVLGAGVKYRPISVPADESQFLDTLQVTATSIATIYGVPAEMIGGKSGGSLTYNTVELATINLLTHTLRPWVTRLESAFGQWLPRNRYVRFNSDAMIRLDSRTRHEMYQIDREIGLRSIDEIRVLEDLEPLPGGLGNDYTPLRVAASQKAEDDDPDDEDDDSKKSKPPGLRMVYGK